MKRPLTVFSIIMLIVGSFGLRALAQTTVNTINIVNGTDKGNVGTPDPTKNTFQIISCDPQFDPNNKDANGVNQLKNDCNYDQLMYSIQRLLNFAIYIILPIILGMVLYSGFKYITAGGDANLIADAKRMFTPILIGLALVLSAWLIVHTILDKLLATDLGNGITKQDVIGN